MVGSPVHQKPSILEHFLDGLDQIDDTGLDLQFVFVDDNEDPESSGLLRQFAEELSRVMVVPVDARPHYECDEQTHRWNEQLVWRVASFKDALIEFAIEQGHDYLMLIDSDLVVNPRTVRHLAERHVDIVSQVFWTRWQPQAPEMPQVWLRDVYDMVPRMRGEEPPPAEAHRRACAFVDQLRAPGIYEVGGLGACTLISRRAMLAGARFREIPNLSFWGEDRHFCIRAAALGLQLHADTVLPPLHLYRVSDLARVDEYCSRNGMAARSGRWRGAGRSVA